MEINGGYGEQRRRHWEREEKRVSKGSKGREKQVWRSDGNKKRVTGAEPVTLGARPPLTPKGFSVPELSFVSFQSIRKCCWALLFPPAGLRSSLDALIHRVVQGPVFNKKRKEKKRNSNKSSLSYLPGISSHDDDDSDGYLSAYLVEPNHGWPVGCDIRWCPTETPHMALGYRVFRASKMRRANTGKRQVATCQFPVGGAIHNPVDSRRKNVTDPGQREGQGSLSSAIDKVDMIVGEAVFENPSW